MSWILQLMHHMEKVIFSNLVGKWKIRVRKQRRLQHAARRSRLNSVPARTRQGRRQSPLSTPFGGLI
jgi:hypothetical protein